MPELEDFLASLEGEDTNQEQENPENPVDPKKFKEWAYGTRKTIKAYEKELKDLREFQTKTVAEQRVGALKAAGLNEFHAEAFSKFYPEVTPETVAEYKTRAGLAAAPVEETEPPAPETPSPGFAPTSIGTPPPPGKTYSRAEWIALADKDSATAQRVFQEGRVDLSGLREGLGPE